MNSRNAFWISLVCGISLACSPVLAQGAPQDAPPPPPNGEQSGPPSDGQAGTRPGLPPLPRLDNMDERDSRRTITGPYRLTYTLTEMDGNKRLGSHRYEIVLDAGWDIQPSQLRLGTKVPIETGEFQANSSAQTTISYIDVGLNIEASLKQFANGLQLRSHVIQSAVDPQQSVAKQPVIRQTDFRSDILLNEGKSLTIGNVDMPGTTHVLKIEVEVNKIP
jgi:hypothetical protein